MTNVGKRQLKLKSESTSILSILIPTKNRVETLIHALDSCMKCDFQEDSIEIIIQDCGSSDNFRHVLENKGCKKVKYFYSWDSPSMTENWNRAISNSTGEYICGIGDDDAVLPNIYDLVIYAKKNNIDSIYQPMLNYIWPDAYENMYSSGKLTIPPFKENPPIDIIAERDLVISKCGIGYNKYLPSIYHGIVKRDILEDYRAKSGKYLGETSFDVYSSLVISTLTKKYYYSTSPFSVRGASKHSNSNRIKQKTSYEHFLEIKNYCGYDRLPKIFSADVSVAETCLNAIQDLKGVNISIGASMNLEYIYAKSAANNIFIIMKLLKYINQKKDLNINIIIIFKYIISYIYDRVSIYAVERGLFIFEKISNDLSN